MRSFAETIGKGVAGVSGSVLAVMDITTVGKVVGVLVGVASLVSIGFDIRRKWRHRRE